jgi:hypothetical protein
MSRDEIQNIIVTYLKNYNPKYVGLFGSYSHASNEEYNDIDVLVKFNDQFSLLQLIKIENDLSEKVGVKVDLVTEGALQNERIKASILKDMKIIFQA